MSTQAKPGDEVASDAAAVATFNVRIELTEGSNCLCPRCMAEIRRVLSAWVAHLVFHGLKDNDPALNFPGNYKVIVSENHQKP